MDKLLALRMFVGAVEAAGFSAAARQLGVATSSVTRTIDNLEAELGAALLNRSTRRVSVTEAGNAYYQHARDILAAVERADAAVADRGSEPSGQLRISVPVEFGRQIIAPRLPDFLQRYPRIELSMTLTDEVVDLQSERVDVSVRLGSLVVSADVISRTLGHFQRWLLASPDYLAAHPPIERPGDLLAHACLRFDYANGCPAWTFRQAGEEVRVDVQGRFKSNNADVLRRMALGGAGVVLLADWLVREDVDSGRLARLLAEQQINPGEAQASINALFLPNQRGSARVAAFLDWLEDLLQRH
ncbi:LysR substrate-binding domain-containing protein [Pseudomonas kuykendallii]|uniref:Transcriptional regulator, LysR family n=1 Tax=Pseudomonas kuykendallii TaxID=1007099 RepID=A0A1H3B6D3_9PSED|nr:LysR family transcriptional regulator [Pseudomonas kuykendallii]MCQ4270035.1 LysR substrate-binding domain-containing protein [Pseudomonas kuykendallii]SDX37345.1 transcriptional regulator, LysR family [Pseudomonas kuykendallii]